MDSHTVVLDTDDDDKGYRRVFGTLGYSYTAMERIRIDGVLYVRDSLHRIHNPQLFTIKEGDDLDTHDNCVYCCSAFSSRFRVSVAAERERESITFKVDFDLEFAATSRHP